MSFEAVPGGVAGVKDRLDAVRAAFLNEDALLSVSRAAREMILKRTDGGVGFEGTAFVPYSSAYKKAREKEGRPLEKVDLKSSGQMLDDLALEVNKAEKRAEIFFKTEESARKARRHQVSGVGKGKVLRRFFGLSEEEKSGLTGLYSAHVENVLKENI
jgi:hypothetical protein